MKKNTDLDPRKRVDRPVCGVEEKEAQEIAGHLNKILAEEFALFTKTLNYHWNITRPRFHTIHEFLESQYKKLLIIIDDLAERIRLIGERPNSTVKEMQQMMGGEEEDSKSISTNQMLGRLLESHQLIQREIRDFLGKDELCDKDPGTDDFVTAVLQEHEMMSWMLKSHLD